MRALYSAEEDSRGEIAIAATKGEWQSVIDQLLMGFKEPEGAPANLVHWLINQGVYE